GGIGDADHRSGEHAHADRGLWRRVDERQAASPAQLRVHGPMGGEPLRQPPGPPPAVRSPRGEATLAGRRRDRLRDLPAIDELVRAVDGATSGPRGRLVEAARAVVADSRAAVLRAATPEALEAVPLDAPSLAAAVRARLAVAAAWRLERVVNATGVVLHTNLGRAPLGPAALA